MTNEFQPRMLRMKNLTKYCDLSRAYLYAKIKEGSFPSGKKISIGITCWEKSEVDAWLDQRIGK